MSKSWEQFYQFNFFRACYEGEGDGGEGGEGGEGTTTTTPPKEGGSEKIFTESEVNKMMAKVRKEHKGKTEKTISELKQLREASKASQDERDRLSGQIEELEKSLMTSEERLAKEKADAAKKHTVELEKAQKETGTWKTRFVDSTIQRALTDAAASTDAVSAQQIVAMYRGATELAQDSDEDGNLLDSYTPVMEFIGLDEDKKQQTFKLPVSEAIAKLKEDGLNNNLFKHNATPGTGASPNSGSRSGKSRSPGERPVREDFSSQEEFTNAYAAWRREYTAFGNKKG